MPSSGKSVKPTVLGMITMELPHNQLISEAISQPIFINDPTNQSLELLLQYRHVFLWPRFLYRVKKWLKMLTSDIFTTILGIF